MAPVRLEEREYDAFVSGLQARGSSPHVRSRADLLVFLAQSESWCLDADHPELQHWADEEAARHSG